MAFVENRSVWDLSVTPTIKELTMSTTISNDFYMLNIAQYVGRFILYVHVPRIEHGRYHP